MAEQTQQTMLDTLLKRMNAELEKDSEQLYRKLKGSEIQSGLVDVPPDQYDMYYREHWNDPNERQKLMTAKLGEDAIREAFRIKAPHVSNHVQTEYINMLKAGVDPQHAYEYAQEMHNAEQMKLHAKDPLPPAMLAPPMMPGPAMPAPVPPPAPSAPPPPAPPMPPGVA